MAASLVVLPGLWLARVFRRQLPGALYPAAACVLAPFALAVELVATSLTGASFSTFLRWVAPLNLLALLLLGRADARRARGTWPAVGTALLLLAPLAVLLFEQPLFRQYGWHNMMQIAAIEQFDALPRAPEDMDAAGLRLNYGWLGLTQLATISRILGVSPTLLFFALNVVQFVALFLFCSAATRRLGERRRAVACLATAGVLLLPGSFDLLWASSSSEFAFRGDARITPLTAKFLYVDAMVIGVSSVSLLVYATVRCLLTPDLRIAALALVAAIACGLTYPLLYPSCALVIAMLGIALLLSPWLRRARRSRESLRSAVLLFAGLATSTMITFGYVGFLGASADAHPLRIADRPSVSRHLVQLAFVFGATVAVTAFTVRLRVVRERLLAWGVLAAMFTALCGSFVVLMMPSSVEYKFLFAAALVSAPAVAGSLGRSVSGGTRPLVALGSLLAVLLAGTSVALWKWHVPRGLLARARPLDETSPEVHPSSGWRGSWMEAVRDATPADAVLLTGPSDQPLSVFTGRALYMSIDGPAGAGRRAPRTGYSMPRDDVLLAIKGYPAQVIHERESVVRQCLASDRGVDVHAILAALAVLDRPIVLHVASPSTLFEWLRMRNAGRVVYARPPDLVWLVDAMTLRAAAGSPSDP